MSPINPFTYSAPGKTGHVHSDSRIVDQDQSIRSAGALMGNASHGLLYNQMKRLFCPTGAYSVQLAPILSNLRLFCESVGKWEVSWIKLEVSWKR